MGTETLLTADTDGQVEAFHPLDDDEGNGGRILILKAKIQRKYLDKILSGQKTMEFRQFNGNDLMEVTDEFGKTTMLSIEGADVANEELERAIKMNNKDIQWSEEPILVLRVKPKSQRTVTIPDDTKR